MTRKDYVKLAEALKNRRPCETWLNKMVQWVHDRDAVSEVLAQDNPKFNRNRFIKATEA